ncbi:AMP-binding protein [Streptomyces broussonetiae]|uniref:acetate--CoA ligase n=1 Tax=Streptomyces broussonetiae TaxID=2686304 RepID=A0ABV5EFW2_9ACTN
MNDHAWYPPPELVEHSNITAFCRRYGVDGGHRALQARSAADPAWFWERAVVDLGIVWHEPPCRVLDDFGGMAAARWFPGARTNLADSCLERHLRQGRGTAPALRFEREDGSRGVLTYAETAALSARVAGGLRALGVAEGDRVACHLPPGAEAFVLLFACARIGAILVPLFSGFGAGAIALRLADAGAKVLVTAAHTTRRGRRYAMAPVARDALRGAPAVRHLVVVPTADDDTTATSWDALSAADPAPVRSLPADAPFLLLHTSGTTGRPKGAVHTHGGFPAQVGSEVRYHLDVHRQDVVCWVTDPGWIMFPLVAIGATLAGASVLAYEGAVDHPDAGRLWRLLADHGVTVFGSSPSLSRALMDRAPAVPAAPGSLRILASTGEPWTEEAWHWYSASFGGKRCPVVNICGGTEAGGSLLASAPTVPQSPGGFAGPCLGIDAVIEDGTGVEPPEGVPGELVVRRPWPGMTRGLWGSRDRFTETYFARRPGRWSHGDLVSRRGGEWFVHGRLDDVVKVAGKRLGPAEAEDAVVTDPAVAEAAAVGVPHPVKGEALWCFAVAAPGHTLGPADADRITARVADALGAAFRPARVVAVPELPRTRNGKTVRRLLRALATGTDPGDLSTLANPGCLDTIRAALTA